jgi:ubiquinone/menaquinone biosynthesis C-methylase UbiE
MVKDKKFKHFFHESMEDLKEKEWRRIKLYDMEKQDTIASIGAGWGRWEVAWGTLLDSMVFFLEDIDTADLNPEELRFNLDYYEKLSGKPVNSSYQIIIGDEKNTHLPYRFFKKVIVVNAFHEFSEKEKMIRELNRILKTGGKLYLGEFDAFHSGDVHMGCGNTIYMEKEIVEMFERDGFTFLHSEWDFKPIGKVPGSKVYVFEKNVSLF